MTTYQGPHAAVKQQFITSPGQISIEDLPPTIVATAYDVYRKESLGSSYGIVDNELSWGADKVVYNKDVIDQKAFDFYPATNFANTVFGQLNLETPDSQISSTGVTVLRDDAFSIPNVENATGTSKAIIPYYKAILSAGDVQILATDLDTVIISGGAAVTSRIKPGQKVFITTDGGASWTNVGVVGSIGNDETKINLASAYSAAITTGDGIVVGAVSDTLIDRPNTLWDPNADFVANRVKVGDVLVFNSLAISSSLTTPIKASITSVVDKNTIKFNTEVLAAGAVDSDYLKYQASTQEPGSTVNVNYYDIQRYLGFSQNYQLKTLNAAAGVDITVIGPNSFSYVAAGALALSQGDLFIVTDLNPPGHTGAVGTEERDTSNIRIYTIATISLVGANYVVTTEEAIYQSGPAGEVAAATGNFLSAWRPKVQTEIVSDFRAVRDEESGVVKKITSVEDIFDAFVRDGYDEIDPWNELAFMTNIAFQNSGGKVTYAVNVDASSAGLAGEYGNALDELRMYDTYSHAFGTTDGGVNALMAPYVNSESEPYEAHEKIGLVSYDEEDVFLMGVDTGDSDATGLITISGSFDPITAGVTVKDKVKVYDSSGDFVEEVTVTETPTVINQVKTDSTTVHVSGHTFKFLSGRKDDQAIRIGALGFGERRVAVVWPGSFGADYGDTRINAPGYFITAAIAGMDSGFVASQSFTNLNFSIPGLSNYELGTNTNYRKLYLDEMGGGGVDVMIQEASISQNIKSRHDLTTNMDSVEFRERSITKQADVAAKTIRSAVSPYIGKYNITQSLIQFLGQTCAIVATKLVKDGILQRLDVKSIKRDPVVADKINIVLEATVYVAGNYYDITLIVKSR